MPRSASRTGRGFPRGRGPARPRRRRGRTREGAKAPEGARRVVRYRRAGRLLPGQETTWRGARTAEAGARRTAPAVVPSAPSGPCEHGGKWTSVFFTANPRERRTFSGRKFYIPALDTRR